MMNAYFRTREGTKNIEKTTDAVYASAKLNAPGKENIQIVKQFYTNTIIVEE